MPSEIEEVERKPGIGAVFSLTIFTAFGIATGFLRELVVTYFYGTSAAADGFAIVFFYYEFFYAFVLGGLGSLSIVPYLARMRARDEESQGVRVVNTTALWFGILTFGVALLGILFADRLVEMTMPGLSAVQLATTIELIHWCALGIVPLVVGLLLAAKMQAYYRVNLTPIGRMAQNVGIIVTTLVFVWFSGVVAAGLGLIVGAASFLLFMLLATRHGKREGFAPIFDRRILDLLKLMIVPALLIILFNYVLVVVELYFLAQLGEGAISGFRYGRRLLVIVTSLGYSIQTVYFARAAKEGEMTDDPNSKAALLAGTICDTTTVLAPASAVLMLIATPLVSLLFQRGSFGVESTIVTSTALRWLAIGLLGNILYGVYIRAAILLRRSGLSLLCAVTVVATTFAFNLLTVAHFGIAAVAMGFSLAMISASLVGHLIITWNLRGQKEMRQVGRSALTDFAVAMISSVPVWLIANRIYPGVPDGAFSAVIQLVAVASMYAVVFILSSIITRRTNIFRIVVRLLKRI